MRALPNVLPPPKSTSTPVAANSTPASSPPAPPKETNGVAKAGATLANGAAEAKGLEGLSPPSTKEAPPPAATSPAPYATANSTPTATDAKGAAKGAGPGLDMEWDDEEEATHVLPEKEPSPDTKRRSTPPPAAGLGPSSRLPGVPGVPPPPPPQTMPGIGFRPLSAPPPNALGGFARASAGAAPPMGSATLGGLGVPGLTPPPPGALSPAAPMGGPLPPPGQVNTAPIPVPVPGPRPSLPSTPQATRAMEQTAMVRPATSRTGLFMGIGFLCLVAVAGLVFTLGVSRTGSMRVNATDGKGGSLSRVEIFVDGRKVCDTSPCLVDSLAAGNHTVKALVGDTAVDKSAAVEARAEAVVDIAISGAQSATKGSGLKVSGTQPGARLSLDGKEIGPLPQEIHDITPGEHKVRIASTERYEPFEKTITVAKDETLNLENVVLKVLKGKATITLGTTGAKVTLVSGTVRKDIPTFPISVDIDTTQNWTLEASKSGFVDFKLPISFADGQAEKTIHVELEPKGSMSSNQAAAQPRAEHSAPAPQAAAATPKPPVEKPAASAAEKPASSSGTGDASLDINSIPASSVLLDGKPIGNTPRVKIPVGAGNHTVTFVNSEQGLKKSVQVTVGAGENKKVIQKLRE